LGRADGRTDRADRHLDTSSGARETDTQLKRRLEEAFGDVLAAPIGQKLDQTEMWVAAQDLPKVMTRLHDDEQFEFELLADLCGVDTGSEMWAVYHLWSPRSSDWLRVIVPGLSRDDPRVPSVTFIWTGAEWPEREAYDMFGIIFEGNRDLRRIYMPPDYTSFPLRKDFLLPDDSARSPGEGVRHVEQTHQPAEDMRRPVLRQAAALPDSVSTISQLPEEAETPPA
jgi:NADH-quinone oxidoreductase subunit C